jgi:hypothetical protein
MISIRSIIDAGPSRDSRRRVLSLILTSPESIFFWFTDFFFYHVQRGPMGK